MATELGADHVVNARDDDPVAAIQELGGADVAVALAASPQSFDQAFRSLRRGGRLVCVALPADGTMTLPIFDTVLNGKSVIGSIVGTRNDLADVFALHAAGRTKVIAVDRKLDEVNQSIDDVLAGDDPRPRRLPVLIALRGNGRWPNNRIASWSASTDRSRRSWHCSGRHESPQRPAPPSKR